MQARLLVTALEGALVDADQQMPLRTLTAIQRFRAAGGQVVLATGRSVEGARSLAAMVGVQAPAILYHGGMIYDYRLNRPLAVTVLEPEVARVALQLLAAMPEVTGVAFADGRAFTDARPGGAEDPALAWVARVERLHPEPVVDLGVLAGRPINKVLARGAPGVVAEFSRWLAGAAPGARLRTLSPGWVEVIPLAASRAEAVVWVAERLAVPLHRVAVLAAAPDDAEMLAVAGLPLAAAAAAGEQAAGAALVTGAPGEVVAEAIDRFCLAPA